MTSSINNIHFKFRQGLVTSSCKKVITNPIEYYNKFEKKIQKIGKFLKFEEDKIFNNFKKNLYNKKIKSKILESKIKTDEVKIKINSRILI